MNGRRAGFAQHRSWVVLAALGLAAVAGCSGPILARVDLAEPRAMAPESSVVAGKTTAGAIFNEGSYRPLFENIRARQVGDTLTVTIQESTTARQSSNTEVNREGSLEGSVTALPFVTSPLIGQAQAKGGLKNDSKSKGESGSDNVFTGNITATVVEVRPNGHLLVVGEKQVGVNQTVDVLRFSGLVDPRFIRPGNTIASTQIAEARLEFRRRGDIDRAMTVGWLQRFFFSLAPL